MKSPKMPILALISVLIMTVSPVAANAQYDFDDYYGGGCYDCFDYGYDDHGYDDYDYDYDYGYDDFGYGYSYDYGYWAPTYSYPTYQTYPVYPTYSNYQPYSSHSGYPFVASAYPASVYSPVSYPSNNNYRYPGSYGTPTGDLVPWSTEQMCYYPDYGRSSCDYDPRQRIYDPWTGSWY